MADELLTIEEAAARIRRPVATLRYWRHRGEGPRAFKIGARVMYKAGDVDGWLEEQYSAADQASA